MKVRKNVFSNPRINPLFVEISALKGSVFAVGDPKGNDLEPHC